MKNKKVLALLISLVLIVAVALPGTLAVSSDQDAVNSDFTVDTASPAPETASPAPETQETTGEPGQAVAPEIPEPVLTCTCDPAPAEGEAHKEGCPLYVDPNAPIVINHIETCIEDCTGEECTCVCHLYEKIMAAESFDEIRLLLGGASAEAIDALTDEMKAKIDEKLISLESAPVPAIIVEETTDEIVPSEIVYPTVNYAYVAPFVGGQG